MASKSTSYRKAQPAALSCRNAVCSEVQICRLSPKKRRGKPIAATVVDISIYGCRLTIAGRLKEDQVIEFQFSPDKAMAASIVWQKDGEAGCRFDAPISPAMMKSLSPSH